MFESGSTIERVILKRFSTRIIGICEAWCHDDVIKTTRPGYQALWRHRSPWCCNVFYCAVTPLSAVTSLIVSLTQPRECVITICTCAPLTFAVYQACNDTSSDDGSTTNEFRGWFNLRNMSFSRCFRLWLSVLGSPLFRHGVWVAPLTTATLSTRPASLCFYKKIC